MDDDENTVEAAAVADSCYTQYDEKLRPSDNYNYDKTKLDDDDDDDERAELPGIEPPPPAKPQHSVDHVDDCDTHM